MTLEQLFERKVNEVRARFFYPSIPNPELTRETPNGSADIVSSQIKINPDYIVMLEKEQIPQQESLDEVLSHEYAHITRFPANPGRRMHQYMIARSLLDRKEIAEAAVYAFNEAQTNLFVGIDMKNEATPRVQKVLARGSRGLNKILNGVYQSLFRQKLGIRLSKDERKLADELSLLDYTDQDNEDANLRKFIDLVKDHLDNYKPRTNAGFLGMFSQEQIEEALPSLAQECMDNGYTPEQYGQLVAELDADKKITPAAGKEKGSLIVARDIYSQLARNFAVPIINKSIVKNGSLIPERQDPYSIGDSFDGLDPFSTPGILPGVTKKWTSREGETAKKAGIPNSIIVIDNSPSMPDPNLVVSIPVLGSSVIARAYLLNDRTVTVYSFGSFHQTAGPSTDEAEISKVLRGYSKKGGTTFKPEELELLLKNRSDVFDLSIVSDMEISNLDDFIGSVSDIPHMHRIHLFYTNPEKMNYVKKVADTTRSMQNIGYAGLSSKEDIEKITLGELKKSLA